MSLKKRLRQAKERHLTPKEAVILWIHETRQFDSLIDYGTWLLDQPEENYPLVKMPAQVVAAVRAANPGVKDEYLREEFYRVQKDVLFLFHLHSRLNMRVMQEEETRRLALDLLSERLHGLILSVYAVDLGRLDGFTFPPDLSRPLAPRRKADHELALEEQLAAWPREEALLWGEVSAMRQAERLLSERYLGGEELLYPQTARGLEAILASLKELRETYRSVLAQRPPDSDEEYVRWLAGDDCPQDLRPLPPEPPPMDRPHTTRTARALAEHFILVARADTLEHLGERDQGIRMVQEWMRAHQLAG
ncbi:MAG: hypothetical protein JXA87_09960 [Thermoleophilia bacterium]|nr:hypothetical protein [Thermoleophilia bacterium]